MSQTIVEMELDQIVPSPTNPRKYFNEARLNELAVSIAKTKGVIQAVTVRPHPKQKNKYELVCGERRYRASGIAEMPTISAVVKQLSDDEVMELQFIENIEREDVHPMDEAVTFKAMIENKNRPWTIDDIAAKINKPASYVAQRLQLNNLIPKLQQEFWDDKFLVGHAILFARLLEKDQKEVVSNYNVFNSREKVYSAVKVVAHFIEQNIMRKLSAAAFKKEDSKLVPEVGACIGCANRTGGNATLFPDLKDDDRCLDGKCFNLKSQAFLLIETERVLREQPEVFLIIQGGEAATPLRKLAEKFKVHILNYSDNGLSENKNYGYTPIKVLWLTGNKVGKITTVYKEMSSKAKIAAKTASGQQITVEDLDEQISSIKQRQARGLELDAEKIWSKVSETIKDVTAFKSGDSLFTSPTKPSPEEKNAMAFALLLGIKFSHTSYLKEAAKILGIEHTSYFNQIRTVKEIKNVSENQIISLLRLYTLCVLNEGLSHVSSAGPFALMPALQTDPYFKNEIQGLMDDQDIAKQKREKNAQKKIAELVEQKKTLKPKKVKPAAAAKVNNKMVDA